jgi:hypothetical protein
VTGLQASNLGRGGRDLLDIPFCGYSPVPSDPTVPLCNRSAAAHITPLDRGEEAGWTIYACAQHADLAIGDQTWDWHPVSAACNAPDSSWVQGTAFLVSRCALPRGQAGGLA